VAVVYVQRLALWVGNAAAVYVGAGPVAGVGYRHQQRYTSTGERKRNVPEVSRMSQVLAVAENSSAKRHTA